jgi:DNA-binding XRE family transcriptional regulator
MKLHGQITHKEFGTRLLKKPGYIEAGEKLGPEFKLYKALIEARIKKNLTQRELSKQLGINQSALARFESGKTNPTLSFLYKITRGLGMKISIL